jgi:hypothetical protein
MKRAQERHHLWRRSQIAGAYDWVEVAGMRVRNVVDLCREHHRMITENKAWIEYDEEWRGFWWYFRVRGDNWAQAGPLQFVVDDKTYCPSCGQRRSRPVAAEKPPSKRKAKSLTITVPDDAEDGAAVFDTLAEALCDELGYTGKKGLQRYHACLAAMHFALVNKNQFLEEREQ